MGTINYERHLEHSYNIVFIIVLFVGYFSLFLARLYMVINATLCVVCVCVRVCVRACVCIFACAKVLK